MRESDVLGCRMSTCRDGVVRAVPSRGLYSEREAPRDVGLDMANLVLQPHRVTARAAVLDAVSSSGRFQALKTCPARGLGISHRSLKPNEESCCKNENVSSPQRARYRHTEGHIMSHATRPSVDNTRRRHPQHLVSSRTASGVENALRDVARQHRVGHCPMHIAYAHTHSTRMPPQPGPARRARCG